MSVYVDNCRIPYGRMLMCHMVADSRRELSTMAHTIGVSRRHIQELGQPNEHFDICQSKRALAIAAGALPVTSSELVKILLRGR